MGTVLSGPMFEATRSEFWSSIHSKQGAHYNIYEFIGDPVRSMDALCQMFPTGEANEYNLCLFSTSGIHGTYSTIEEEETRPDGEMYDDGSPIKPHITFLIIHPRLVCMRYGEVEPQTTEDFEWLKKLRESSWKVVQAIGRPEYEREAL